MLYYRYIIKDLNTLGTRIRAIYSTHTFKIDIIITNLTKLAHSRVAIGAVINQFQASESFLEKISISEYTLRQTAGSSHS